MNNKEIQKDSKFLRVCSKYDIYTGNVSKIGDFLLVNSPGKDIYILLDKDYNTLAIEKAYITNVDKFVNSLYQEYNNYSKKLCFSYPFEKINFKQILDMSNRIHLICKDEKIIMMINGINCIYKKNDDYSMLLSYIKFLGKEIKNYQSYVFINKKLGVEVMDVASYIEILIKKINDFIDTSIKNGKVIYTDELIEHMNNDEFEYHEYKFLLDEIIKLLLKQKGYKIKNNKLEKSPISRISNLSDKTYQLLAILNMTNFHLRQKIIKNNEDDVKDIFEIIELEEKAFYIKKQPTFIKKILKKLK